MNYYFFPLKLVKRKIKKSKLLLFLFFRCRCRSQDDEQPLVGVEQMMFAVKSYEKFHTERLPVVLNTWGKQAHHMRIFSNVANESIPTIATGVTNTETGHCEKTIKILRLIEDELNANQRLGKQINWVVLVDDDTVLSVHKLARHLSCYHPDTDLYLGERYGYMLDDNDQSYSFITGGGGIILSRSATKFATSCQCPSPASPDDMILAACLSQYSVFATHSPLFHQARPIDYPAAAIDSNTISFHKYWQIDPYDVYWHWFKAADDDNHLHRITKQSNQLQHQSSGCEHMDNTVEADGTAESSNECNCDASVICRRNCEKCGNQIIKTNDFEMNHTDL